MARLKTRVDAIERKARPQADGWLCVQQDLNDFALYHGQGARTDLTLLNSLSNVATERNDSTAAAQAANIFNTNRQYVADAKRLMSEAPDLAQHVKAGDMKITEARRQLQQRQKQEAPPLPTDKYRIIYADPPWKYSNSGSIETANGREVFTSCLLYTSDAGDDPLCVDLGGRRILKKNNTRLT